MLQIFPSHRRWVFWGRGVGDDDLFCASPSGADRREGFVERREDDFVGFVGSIFKGEVEFTDGVFFQWEGRRIKTGGEAEFLGVLALEERELIERSPCGKREVFVNGDWNGQSAYGFDSCATQNEVKFLLEMNSVLFLHYLDREFRNLVAPERDVTGALL